MVAFEIPTGVVADTLGRRVSYLASVAILAVTTVLYVAAAELGAGLVAFGAVSIGMGLGFTFYSGALEAWLVDALNAAGGGDDLDRVFARGQQVSGAAMLIGTIAGGVLGQVDLALPFLVRSLLLVVVFVIAGRLMVEVGFDPKPLALGQVPAAMAAQARVGVAAGWNHGGLRLLMLAAAIRGLFLGWAFYAAQPYMLELLQRDAVWVVGLVTAGVSLSTIVGNAVVERVSRRCGRRSTLLLWASAVCAVAGVVIGVTSSFWIACAGLFLISGAMGVITPVRQAYLHQVTESENRATVISFDAMVQSVGGVGGQVGLGQLAQARTYGAGYVVGGAMTTLALPALWLLRRRDDAADHLGPAAERTDSATTCPAVPAETGVRALPVAHLTDR
jgi:MFS family permease